MSWHRRSYRYPFSFPSFRNLQLASSSWARIEKAWEDRDLVAVIYRALNLGETSFWASTQSLMVDAETCFGIDGPKGYLGYTNDRHRFQVSSLRYNSPPSANHRASPKVLSVWGVIDDKSRASGKADLAFESRTAPQLLSEVWQLLDAL